MTNREADRAISRIERTALMRFVLTSRINGSAVFAVVFLALFAFVFGAGFIAMWLLIVSTIVFASSSWINFRDYRNRRKIEFWKLIRKQGLCAEPPTGDTKLLIDKIIQIQTAAPNDEILPTRQAVKLVDAYERQARQLGAVNARLSQMGATRSAINDKIKQLQALGENHAAGLRSLEQTRASFEALWQVARAIKSSCDRLEMILDGARKTARTRQLHRELDRLSTPATSHGEPAFEAESNEEIERQIGREIETYLQLERETEEHLR